MEWKRTAKEPPQEKDGDCCGRVMIAYAGAHCATVASWKHVKENPEAVPVWMPLPKIPWEDEEERDESE